MTKIVSRREIVPNVHELIVDAPDVAKKAQPGQFAIVIPDEVGERIPISIADWSIEEGTVTMYFLEVGVSTMKLARKRDGDDIDFMAPLGKPATVDKFGTVLIGGGCYGIGAIYPIVRAYKEAGNRVITVIEARDKNLFYMVDKLERYSDMMLFATTTGTLGRKGKVRTVLRDLVEDGEHIDLGYFIGCTFMMMLCALEAKELGIESLVYLNPIMVDATGMCGVCRVNVAGETKFACVDGPEFPGANIDWDDLFKRNNQYAKHQTLAYQYKHGASYMGHGGVA